MQHGPGHEPGVAAVQPGHGVAEVDGHPGGQAGGDLEHPPLEPPEHGRPAPRSATAAVQSTTATAAPLPGLAITLTNPSPKSSRSSQDPAISSPAAAPALSEPSPWARSAAASKPLTGPARPAAWRRVPA